jgi:hypothetical protein
MPLFLLAGMHTMLPIVYLNYRTTFPKHRAVIDEPTADKNV